jgi:hypothetical protein
MARGVKLLYHSIWCVLGGEGVEVDVNFFIRDLVALRDIRPTSQRNCAGPYTISDEFMNRLADLPQPRNFVVVHCGRRKSLKLRHSDPAPIPPHMLTMATTTPPTQTQPLPKEKEKEREKESSKLELNRDLMVLTSNALRISILTALQKSFRPARIFKAAVESTPQLPNGRPGAPRHITGISFDDTGEFVLTAAEDDNYRFYACRSGKRVCSSLFAPTHLIFVADRQRRSILRNMASISPDSRTLKAT